MNPGFAVWITGLPASGKSSTARLLREILSKMGINCLILESDEMRKILTPNPTYTAAERDRFYNTLAMLGEMLTRNGINVIFDATANLRAYRDYARSIIPRFIEVYISCPLEVCVERDPKGIYAMAVSGGADTVPGLQAGYEPPASPEVTIDCLIPLSKGVDSILQVLKEFQYI